MLTLTYIFRNIFLHDDIVFNFLINVLIHNQIYFIISIKLNINFSRTFSYKQQPNIFSIKKLKFKLKTFNLLFHKYIKIRKLKLNMVQYIFKKEKKIFNNILLKKEKSRCWSCVSATIASNTDEIFYGNLGKCNAHGKKVPLHT